MSYPHQVIASSTSLLSSSPSPSSSTSSKARSPHANHTSSPSLSLPSSSVPSNRRVGKQGVREGRRRRFGLSGCAVSYLMMSAGKGGCKALATIVHHLRLLKQKSQSCQQDQENPNWGATNQSITPPEWPWILHSNACASFNPLATFTTELKKDAGKDLALHMLTPWTILLWKWSWQATLAAWNEHSECASWYGKTSVALSF